MRSIYEYNDYCQYLNDYLQDYIKLSPENTMNSFADAAQIAPSTLSRILNRSRSLSLELAEKIAFALGLKKRRFLYFILLVKMAKEKTVGGQSILRDEIESYKNLNRKTVQPEQYAVFEKWYLFSLRELLCLSPINIELDCLKISRMFKPSVTESQIRKGIQTLIELELAKVDALGYVKSTDAVVSTGDYWDSLFIHNYQRDMAKIAIDALDSTPRDERDFSTLTLCLSHDKFIQAKQIIKECRQRLLGLEDNETSNKNVYNINTHLFPVCKLDEGGKS